MKINSVAHVCDVFMPGEERPINRCFEFEGEKFAICTYKFMRGPFSLRGDETPEGYFILCFSEWLDFRIDVYPEKGTYKKRIGLRKRCKNAEAKKAKFDVIAPKIEAAFLNAITEFDSEVEA